MFERVMDWLESDPETSKAGFGDGDVRLAVAALFYHMIAVDGSVTQDEIDRLRTLLRDEFQLNELQLAQLAKEGEDADRTSAGVFPFSVILNRQLEQADRQRIFSELKALAMADGVVHPLEKELLGHMKFMLKLDVA